MVPALLLLTLMPPYDVIKAPATRFELRSPNESLFPTVFPIIVITYVNGSDELFPKNTFP
jgi:hypothetical protein